MSNTNNERSRADRGEFFFAAFFDPGTGRTIKHPVLIVGKNQDSNDEQDVIVCNCTSQPARSAYDVPVALKKPTLVRTNKIYTIRRDQLLFKIAHSVDQSIMTKILHTVAKTIADA